jgi:NADPH:quinone reductase
MRAVSITTYGGPEVLELVDIPVPTPGEGEVTIDVKFAGVGFVDVLFRRGAFALTALPLTPGIEVTGLVRQVGSGVHGLAIGMAVAALLNDFVNLPGCGGYAEVARARAALAIPLPPNTDLSSAAAALVNGATAWLAIHELARLRRSESVFVPGATGGLAGLICQLARRVGASPINGTVSRMEKREAALRLGYDDILAAELSTEWLQNVYGQRGIDVVFDAVGGASRRIAFQHLAPLGRLVILGNASGADVAFSGDEFWHGSTTVQGLSLGRLTHLVPDKIATAAQEVLGLVANREIRTEPARVLPLSQAAEAHRLIESRSATGKMVLQVA